jgi:hypothetical protein
MPSRNKRPATTTIDIVHHDERTERRTIPIDDFPRVLMLPKYSVPEVLSGRPAEAPEPWMVYHRKDVERVMQYGGKGFTAARFDLTAFARMLAKIAHAYTVAECGPDCGGMLQTLLPNFILTGSGNPYTCVGADPVSLPAEKFMYRIGCFHHSIGNRNYLCVFVRLYAFIKTSPLYQIAVADITEQAPAQSNRVLS